MGKIIETKINRWDGGMTNDARGTRENVCRIIKHFDNYSVPSKLSPHRDMEVDAATEDTLDTYRIKKFLIANGRIYGSGIVGGANTKTQIYTKTTAYDPTTAWTTLSGGVSADDVATAILFVLRVDDAGNDYVYGSDDAGIWRCVISGTVTFTDNYYTTYIPTGQGLVHSKDNILYVPSDNLLLKESGSGFSVALTLAKNTTIAGLCEYGNYLAIACNKPNGNTIILLWDRDTSLETISEKIDWGFGTLSIFENLGGTLIGISKVTTVYTGSTPSLTAITPKVILKYLRGSEVITFQKFDCDEVYLISQQRFDNMLYFLAAIMINSTLLYGLWKIIKLPDGQINVSFDRLARNDTAITPWGSFLDFIRWGDYVFIAYINAAEKYTIWRTNNAAEYTATSIWESIKFNAGDASLKKDLVGITVMTEYLPTNGQVVVKHKKDNDTSWSSAILTHNVAGAISYSAVVGLPKDYKEIEFHLESINGAEITGLSFMEEITGKKPYG